jgi:hypothetical protein
MAGRGGKRRDPAREKFWRRTIHDQQRRGLSVRDFCQREGLKDWSFRWWRRELTRRDQEPAITHRCEPTGATPAFLPVRVVDLATVAPRPAPAPRAEEARPVDGLRGSFGHLVLPGGGSMD